MYDWKKLGRLLAPAALAVSLPAAAFAAGNCVVFDGVQHCPLGSTSLSTTSSGLQVTGFGSSGTDGVAFQLPGATNWSIAATVKGNSSANSRLVSTAVADGVPTSTMVLQQQGQVLNISATFTGAGGQSTYSALVYKDGVFQGGTGGVPSGQPAMMMPYRNDPIGPVFPPVDPWWWWWPWWWFHDWGFGISMAGGCVHTFDTAGPVDFILANGTTVRGNRVELVEDIPISGSYPYLSFDAMRFQGTLESVTVQSESVR
jgi:hypothetical protein